MDSGDKAKFKALLTDAMAFYRQDVSKYSLSVWWAACQPFDLEQVTKALTAHAMDPDGGQFAPKPADIMRQLAGTVTDRAQVAWGKAHDAAGGVGAYTDVVFDDPVIHAVITDMGGWPKFCRTETADLGYLQHRFCESYRAYSGRKDFEYPRLLGGARSPDDVYAMRGLKAPAPAVVGDIERARLVYRGGRLVQRITKSISSLLESTKTKAMPAPESGAA